MVKAHGSLYDYETRCVHYHSVKDIVAIKFYCCENYYPCYKCHNEDVSHPIKRWPKETFNTLAILCGVCKTDHTIETYLKTDRCPSCAAQYNEDCRTHHAIYFEM